MNVRLFLQRLPWVGRGLLLVGLLLVIVVVYARFDSQRGFSTPQATLCAEHPEANTLVVVIHGYKGTRTRMESVLRAIKESQPHADVLCIEFASSTFSNQNPFALAENIQEVIQQRYRLKHYEHIDLVGHSIGALLARKAYVYGAGSIEDAPYVNGMLVGSRPPKEWVRHVDRIVLLAGMNRGWTREAGSSRMGIGTSVLYTVGLAIGKLSNTGQLIRQFERGEPFVSNLRLQWLDVAAKAKRGENGLRPPTVIQLLGDRDDLVSAEDSRDVAVSKDFIWVNVNNTGHASILDLDDPASGAERRQKFQMALGSPDDLKELVLSNVQLPSNVDTAVTTVVVVLHGIRDMGEWTSAFDIPLQEAFAHVRKDSTEKLYVAPAGYGYFPMGAFLLFADRQKNVRWFMDEVTEIKARFPKLQHLHFIGHSNGTYVLASALAKYRTLKVERIVFAGSVIRRDYPWAGLVGRYQKVRNYVGSDDWVVALFPHLFELPGFSLFNPDLGGAGFNGFEDSDVKLSETQFVKGGHSGALAPANVASIVDFIINGKKTEPPASIHVKAHPGWLAMLSNMCWLVWLALLLLLSYVFWKAPTWTEALLRRYRQAPAQHPKAITWLSRMGYVCLLWLLLNTI